MKRRMLNGIVCGVLLAFLCLGSGLAEAQGCASDAPEGMHNRGIPVIYLGVMTPHHYDSGKPLVVDPASQKLIMGTSGALYITNPDLPITTPTPGILTGVLFDATVDKTDPYPNELSIYVSQDNGVVARIRANGSTTHTNDIGRGGFCVDDLSSALALQLRDLSTSGFQSSHSTDLLYAGTYYKSATGCTTGHNTDNRIFALSGQDLGIAWIFNDYGTVDMDAIFGMAIDTDLSAPVSNPTYGLSAYQEDRFQERLYVTTEKTGPAGQHSVWSINVLTGTLDWSVDAGRIQTNPVVRSDRLYVGTVTGEIRALDKSDGSEHWSLATFLPILRDFAVGRRAPYDDLIALVDYFGDIRLLRDDGSGVTPLWTTDLDSGGGEHATTAPFFDDLHGYIYVGANDGKLYQLDVATGTAGPTRVVNGGGADVTELIRYSPELDDSKPYTNTLFATADTTVARYCTPFMYPTGTLAADGDINMDGDVNAADVMLGMQTVLNLRLLNPDQFGHGDVHPVISNVAMPDGVFDLRDVMAITGKALGLNTF